MENKTFTLKETLTKVNQMYHDGWCENCSEEMQDCINSRQPKCLLIEKIQKENGNG